MDGKIKGLLCDLDGTVYENNRIIAGAAEALQKYRSAGLSVRFVTNTTRMSRRLVHERLAQFGINARVEEIFTAPVAAAAWLKSAGIRRVALLLNSDTFEDFQDFEIDVKEPEAVVVGDLGEAWSFKRLNQAFRWLMGGADLVAIQKNRFWKKEDGLSLDAGPFVAALEYAAGKKAIIVGKPQKLFFGAAVHSMGILPSHVAMIGDDIESDVGGAQAAGLMGILVRTGKFSPEELDQSPFKPDLIVDTIADFKLLQNLTSMA